jgi:hypothetical protein
MTSHSIFAVIFVVVFGAVSIYAFAHKMTEVGLTATFESWRARPRKAVLVGLEFVALMLVAWAFAVSTRWAAVAWYVVGLLVASVMLHSIGRKSEQTPQSAPAQAAAETRIRRPWPPAQTEPPVHLEASQPPDAESPDSAASATPPAALDSPVVAVKESREETTYQAVMEWRQPVPEDYEKRVLIREHAVAYRERVPQPLALCGYKYDPLDLPSDKVFAPWGLGVEKPMRCPVCTKTLRDAGYQLWNVDPWALGR